MLASQAILRALGGNIVSLGKSLQLEGCGLCHHHSEGQEWCNNGGIRSPEAAVSILSALAAKHD